MTNVYLYGQLRNKFGEKFKFNISSPKEALSAINSNRKGFFDEIKKLAIKNVHYRIIIDDVVVENLKEIEIQKAPKEIHIMPIIWGAGNNGGMQILVAVAMIAASFIPGMQGWAVMGLRMIGAALAVQGVMTILYPPPKPDFNQEVQAGGKSYLFGNRSNNTAQGQAVPVGYGRLKIGTSQISAGIDHYALDTDIKQLMTPVDSPVNDYIELITTDETSSAGINTDTFSTKQAVDIEDTVTLSSVNVLNSYIDITTNSANKVTSNPVEVVVKRNGQIISNPDLPYFDENVTYTWEELSNSSSSAKIYPENPFEVKSGLAIRSYHVPDFKVQSEYNNLTSDNSAYFKKYSAGELVKFGPSQFLNLKFATWDYSHTYYSGELIDYPTGGEDHTYFQAIASNFSGQIPTGEGPIINSTYWRKLRPPSNEYLYKCVSAVSGHLPTTGDSSPPVAETTFWSRVDSPANESEMNTLFTDYPAYTRQFPAYIGAVNRISEPLLNNSTSQPDNYGMEFLGYFYVPVVGGDGKSMAKDIYEIGTGTGLYEIIQVGDTGQWSGLGFTGLNGQALPPRIGCTFYKNQVQGNGNGKVMLVGEFQFKVDSDDAADLYIDSKLASSYYGNHAAALPINPTSQQIADAPSTTTSLYLTAGYHRLYARLQESLGGEVMSLYYRYDSNRDGVYSDWSLIPKEKLFHATADLGLPKSQKFADIGKRVLPISSMKFGEEYKIHSQSSTNWTQIGSSSNDVGTVFVKNAITATSSGTVVEDFITYSEAKSAETNRLVRFVSKRPISNGVKSQGSAYYQARYRCKVNINNKEILYSGPVKVNIKFLPTSTPQRGIDDDATISTQVQIS